MNSIEIDEKDLNDIERIHQLLQMQNAKNDPSSIYYERQLNRPKIKWPHFFLILSAPAAMALVLYFFLKNNFGKKKALMFSGCALSACILLLIKKSLICIIQLYQHFAPDNLRKKCRFEPSCSDYMIFAIKKYGVLAGVKKGICRLKRCNINHGGYDYP